MHMIHDIGEARCLLSEGKIIAYPTEAVYGLGCDPFDQKAVKYLLALKQRPIHKGLILLISDWAQLTPLIITISESQLDRARQTWPGPVTWLFPKASMIPDWLSGSHGTIAIRMTNHPVAKQLCLEGPIISTSANISSHLPARDLDNLFAQFPSGVDGCVIGDLGSQKQPSFIYDILTGNRLR